MCVCVCVYLRLRRKVGFMHNCPNLSIKTTDSRREVYFCVPACTLTRVCPVMDIFCLSLNVSVIVIYLTYIDVAVKKYVAEWWGLWCDDNNLTTLEQRQEQVCDPLIHGHVQWPGLHFIVRGPKNLLSQMSLLAVSSAVVCSFVSSPLCPYIPLVSGRGH